MKPNLNTDKKENCNTNYSQYYPEIDTHFILKFSNTFVGFQPNSRIAFSLLNVRDFIIFVNFRELIGAFLPKQSPSNAIPLANQYGIDIGKDFSNCLQIIVSNSLNVG